MKLNAWKRTWLGATAIAFLTAFILILPYIVGHKTARPGTVYTGLLVNLEDGTYLSAIEQGRMGAWLYTSHFTVDAHEPVFLEGFYLALGQAARLTGLSSLTAWHVGLFVGNVILFLMIFGFISLFLKQSRQRFTAYMLALFGAGFDWWAFPAWFEREAAHEVVPIDLRFPEAHIFYSALTFPHFVVGIILILLVFGLTLYLLFLPQGERRRWWLAAAGGVGNLLLGIVYPFLILLPAVVLAFYYLYFLWRQNRWRHPGWLEIWQLALLFIIPLPLYIYYAVIFLNSPALQTWSDQAYTPSPNPVHYLLTYGLYLVLGVLALLRQRGRLGRISTQQLQDDNQKQDDYRLRIDFLWAWVGSAAVLLYLPLNSQRRYVEGLHVPLSILAAVGFFTVVWPWLAQTRIMASIVKRPRYTLAGMQRLTILALIGVAGLGNVYLYSSTLIKLGVQQPYPLFRPQSEYEAMNWLREQIEPGDVVLAGYRTGSFLPYQTGATVIVGNRYETADFERKRSEAAEFFMPETTDRARQALITQDGIRYVFVGPHERDLGGESLRTADYLEPVYQTDEVTIYQVLE